MKHILNMLVLLSISPTGFVLADDVEYAVRIMNSNPEYGTNIPKELCSNNSTTKCQMSTHLLVNPVFSLDSIKDKLTSSAWAALKSNAQKGQEIWEFNLCREKWNQGEVCAEVSGYVVIKNYMPIFYTFQKNQ